MAYRLFWIGTPGFFFEGFLSFNLSVFSLELFFYDASAADGISSLYDSGWSELHQYSSAAANGSASALLGVCFFFSFSLFLLIRLRAACIVFR